MKLLRVGDMLSPMRRKSLDNSRKTVLHGKCQIEEQIKPTISLFTTWNSIFSLYVDRSGAWVLYLNLLIFKWKIKHIKTTSLLLLKSVSCPIHSLKKLDLVVLELKNPLCFTSLLKLFTLDFNFLWLDLEHI